VLEKGNDLNFTKYFWKKCEPLDSDLSQYSKFVTTIRLAYEGVDNDAIANEVGVSARTVKRWINLEKKPKLSHFLKAYLRLGTPDEQRVWLNTEATHGHAIPIGRFITIPLKIRGWRDVELVLDQLEPLPGILLNLDKRYLFGFLLGMIVGDAAKSKQGTSHRHIGLTLSKRYDTNMNIGEFTSQCAQSFGLRMHRARDQPRPLTKPYGFYEWTSQSSPLIDWIFNVALGFQDGQVTTYDPIKADWVMDAPIEFRLGLIQGLAESDASVSISGQVVEFWIGPNYQFMKDFLATFGLRSFRSREAVSLSKGEAVKAFFVPVFCPLLKTIRYQRLQKLAVGKRPSRGGERLPGEVREEIRRLRENGLTFSKIVESILDKYQLLITIEAAQRWASRRNGAMLK
jgi:hypothetical protein